MSERTFTTKEKVKISTLSTLAFGAIYVLENSYRFNNIHYTRPTKPVIYAVWHGWQYGLLGLPDREKIHLLVSKSNDGEIISRTTNLLGYPTIRGSQGRGGTEALRTIVKTLKKGDNIAYTVDGPRGPIKQVKQGVIRIAQMSQVPILPLVPATKYKLIANSWDRYVMPFFLSKVKTVFGKPIHVPKELSDEEVEQYRLNLENTLLRLEIEAEGLIKSK